MNDPWTWTTVWGLTVGGQGWAEEGKGGKSGTLLIVNITIKKTDQVQNRSKQP